MMPLNGGSFFLTNLAAVTLPRWILTKRDGVDSRPVIGRSTVES